MNLGTSNQTRLLLSMAYTGDVLSNPVRLRFWYPWKVEIDPDHTKKLPPLVGNLQ